MIGKTFQWNNLTWMIVEKDRNYVYVTSPSLGNRRMGLLRAIEQLEKSNPRPEYF